jgi:hypothetical protein
MQASNVLILKKNIHEVYLSISKHKLNVDKGSTPEFQKHTTYNLLLVLQYFNFC